ncbi:MAG: helix-turn-helix domain-containing protein [Methylococcaceae bacterium]|nr:helix-turn-helix domain-containing protein [Methylococcaceae bacterium]
MNVESERAAERDSEVGRVIGLNLRRFRKQRGMSLERVSGVSGVSRAMLGQIESGSSVPSIKILWKIARALGLPINAFLGRDGNAGPYLMEARDAKRLARSHGRFHSRALYPADHTGGVQFYELTIAGFAIEEDAPHPPGTTENLVVSRGRLEVTVDTREFRLLVGDAILFEADVPHRYRNPQEEEVQAFLVVNYHDSR